MTVTDRKSSRDARRAGGFTQLERVVMEALARELRGDAPDLAAQFAAARLTVRRNSGFGVFTEMLVPSAPASRLTGEFGRIHVTTPDLDHPLSFRVRLRDGRLMGLLGDSYGQDTRGIDFDTMRPAQLFTVDDHGRSVSLDVEETGEPALSHPGRSPAGPISAGPAPVYIPSQPPPATTVPEPRIEIEPLSQAMPNEPLSDEEKTTLRVGLWTAVFAISALLVLVFGMAFPFVFIAAIIAGRFLQSERGLLLVRRTLASVRQSTGQET